jgi:hypothetical protein
MAVRRSPRGLTLASPARRAACWQLCPRQGACPLHRLAYGIMGARRTSAGSASRGFGAWDGHRRTGLAEAQAGWGLPWRAARHARRGKRRTSWMSPLAWTHAQRTAALVRNWQMGNTWHPDGAARPPPGRPARRSGCPDRRPPGSLGAAPVLTAERLAEATRCRCASSLTDFCSPGVPMVIK